MTSMTYWRAECYFDKHENSCTCIDIHWNLYILQTRSVNWMSLTNHSKLHLKYSICVIVLDERNTKYFRMYRMPCVCVRAYTRVNVSMYENVKVHIYLSFCMYWRRVGEDCAVLNMLNNSCCIVTTIGMCAYKFIQESAAYSSKIWMK